MLFYGVQCQPDGHLKNDDIIVSVAQKIVSLAGVPVV